MVNPRYQQTFLVLVFLVLIFTFAAGKVSFKNIDALQSAFNQKICGGCLTLECTLTKIQLKNLTGYDFPSNPIEHNPFNITQIIFYTNTSTNKFTINGNQYVFQTGFTLALPILANISNFKGVIGYFHGTVFNKSAVPSNLGLQYRALIALYCSQGFAMIFPDEVGLGINYRVAHPYVVNPMPNVQAMVIGLNLYLDELQKKFGKSNTINVFIAGFSEGGSLALLFTHCVSKPWECNGFSESLKMNYKIIKTAGLEGAYDLAGVVMPFLTEDVSDQGENKFHIQTTMLSSLAKPGLAAMAVNSFAFYNSTPFQLKSVLNQGFFQMNCTGPLKTQCNVAEGLHLNISEAFLQKSLNDTRFSMSLASSAMGKQMNGWKYATQIQVSQGVPKNSVLSLLNSSLFTNSFNQTVRQATFVGKNYLFPNQTLLFSLKNDSIVSPLNMINLKDKDQRYSYMLFNNNDYKVCDLNLIKVPVDHLRIEILSNVYAIKYFDPTLTS